MQISMQVHSSSDAEWAPASPIILTERRFSFILFLGGKKRAKQIPTRGEKTVRMSASKSQATSLVVNFKRAPVKKNAVWEWPGKSFVLLLCFLAFFSRLWEFGVADVRTKRLGVDAKTTTPPGVKPWPDSATTTVSGTERTERVKLLGIFAKCRQMKSQLLF